MNIEEYISSGILEAYALGELTAAERAEVEKNLALYSQLREELALIEEAQENFLMQSAVTPKKSVKEKFLSKVDTSESQGKIVSITNTTSQVNFWKFAAAASIAFAVIASYLAYNYYSKWRNTENDLNDLMAQNQQVAKDYNTVNQRMDKIESDLKIMNNPSFSKVVLKGTNNAPEAMVFVYWNATTQEVYLSVQNMKELAQEDQYQLWAIVNGQPVDAGVFDATTSGMLKMKNLAGAAAFAVTIEPRGGRPTPSLGTMQVLGNVVKV